MTSYLLLCKKDGDGEAWSEWRVQDATSAAAAIRAGYLKHGATDIVAIVAVPARSWNPQPIRTETVTRLVLGPASPPETATESDPPPSGAQDE